MVIDIGVCVSDLERLDAFIQIAQRIGFSGFAVHNIEGAPDQSSGTGFSILKRSDVSGRGVKSLRKKVGNVREHSMIVGVKLTSVETANWAAEDQRVDLLTLDPFRECRVRASTAHLAAVSGTALEIRFEPLLHLVGLNRSKVIKSFREAVTTAIDAGMQVILSSGATHPLHMRSPVAMQHLGELLGMTTKYAESAVRIAPLSIVERNRKRLDSGYVAEGVEVVRRGIKK